MRVCVLSLSIMGRKAEVSKTVTFIHHMSKMFFPGESDAMDGPKQVSSSSKFIELVKKEISPDFPNVLFELSTVRDPVSHVARGTRLRLAGSYQQEVIRFKMAAMDLVKDLNQMSEVVTEEIVLDQPDLAG